MEGGKIERILDVEMNVVIINCQGQLKILTKNILKLIFTSNGYI